MENHYTVIIIGGGPIGLACALEAQSAGLDYLILEKGALVNSLYNYPVNMTFFSTSERLEIGEVPFVSNNAKPTRAEALEYYRRVAVSYHVNIHLFEKVIEVKAQGTRNNEEENYKVVTNKNVYSAHYIIIATGFYDIPYKLNVPGEELPKVTHYYKDPHFYAFQNVLIVGANNSAVDAALETSGLRFAGEPREITLGGKPRPTFILDVERPVDDPRPEGDGVPRPPAVAAPPVSSRTIAKVSRSDFRDMRLLRSGRGRDYFGQTR